jgi:hypothetical protein
MRPTLVLLLVALSLAASAGDWIGYGGPNGGRVYPGNPPTRFDQTKEGGGVLWEAALPTWGHGSPLGVADKVFVLCEPGPNNLFPLIVCLDAATGKTLWRKEISTPEQEQHRDALKAWADKHYGAIQAGLDPGKDKGISALKKTAHDLMGLQVDSFRAGMYSNGYACFGEGYGTPVSDGTWVWACTTWGTYVCYALDGTVRWATYDPQLARTTGWCLWGRSPILAGDLLISDVLDRVRAFDKHTGKLVWHRTLARRQDSIATPGVITVGGKDILLTDGPSAFLLPEGTPLTVEGWKDTGMQILVKHDERDVAYFCGSGEHCAWRNKGAADVQPPACFRFTLQGDTLTGTLLWDGATLGGRKAWGNNSPWMVYHEGKLYHREGAILDALTGKVLAGGIGVKPGAVPSTSHLLAIAGGHIYGLAGSSKEPAATMTVYTLDGKKVAQSQLLRREPTLEQQAMHTYCTGNPKPWFTDKKLAGAQPKVAFSYGNAFTFGGDRIFIRSLEGLICVGK